MIEVIVNGQVCFNTKIRSDKHCWQVQHWPQCRSEREGNVTVVDFVLLMTSGYIFLSPKLSGLRASRFIIAKQGSKSYTGRLIM